MKHKYRVFGTTEVVVSTVIESEGNIEPEELYKRASCEFGGIVQKKETAVMGRR